MLRSESKNEIIKKLVEDTNKKGSNGSIGYKLLESFSAKTQSYSSVLRWAHSLNFKYSTWIKSFPVDGNEHK